MAIAFMGTTLSLPAVASASVLGTYTPNPNDMNDLDHHSLYTWRIQDTALIGKTITGASITFSNMFNWDTSGNILYLWLLNNAYLPGATSNYGLVQSALGGTSCSTQIGTTGCVAQFTDDTTTTPTLAQSKNDFGLTGAGTSSTKPGWLVSSADMGTAVDMTNRGFAGPGALPTTSPGPSTTPAGWSVGSAQWVNDPNYGWIKVYDYTYTFSTSDVASLNAFLSDDVFALGLDPDCHIYNSGMTLTLTGDVTVNPNSITPEPTSLVLLGTGAALLLRRRIRSRRARA